MESKASQQQLPDINSTTEPLTGGVYLKVVLENYSRYNLKFLNHHPYGGGSYGCWTADKAEHGEIFILRIFQNSNDLLWLLVPKPNISSCTGTEFHIENKDALADNYGICGSYSWQVMYTTGKPYLIHKKGARFTLTYQVSNWKYDFS